MKIEVVVTDFTVKGNETVLNYKDGKIAVTSSPDISKGAKLEIEVGNDAEKALKHGETVKGTLLGEVVATGGQNTPRRKDF